MMILVKINHLVLNSILDHLHYGLNGDRGVVAVSLVVRETDKEQDHAPALEIAKATVQIQTRVTRIHALIGHHGDHGVVAVLLVARETDKEQDHAPALEIV